MKEVPQKGLSGFRGQFEGVCGLKALGFCLESSGFVAPSLDQDGAQELPTVGHYKTTVDDIDPALPEGP